MPTHGLRVVPGAKPERMRWNAQLHTLFLAPTCIHEKHLLVVLQLTPLMDCHLAHADGNPRICPRLVHLWAQPHEVDLELESAMVGVDEVQGHIINDDQHLHKVQAVRGCSTGSTCQCTTLSNACHSLEA